MSNLPELLRTKAEGLRKEAQEQVHTAEVAFYTAQELVKQAERDDVNSETRSAILKQASEKASVAKEVKPTEVESLFEKIAEIESKKVVTKEVETEQSLYKKACLESLQQLVNSGQLSSDVAEAAAQELERKLA